MMMFGVPDECVAAVNPLKVMFLCVCVSACVSALRWRWTLKRFIVHYKLTFNRLDAHITHTTDHQQYVIIIASSTCTQKNPTARAVQCNSRHSRGFMSSILIGRTHKLCILLYFKTSPHGRNCPLAGKNLPTPSRRAAAALDRIYANTHAHTRTHTCTHICIPVWRSRRPGDAITGECVPGGALVRGYLLHSAKCARAMAAPCDPFAI